MTVKEGEVFCGQHMVVDSLKDCNDNVSWNISVQV
jgi:hypothetical protein